MSPQPPPASDQAKSLRRVLDAEIAPLEVSDVVVDGRTLWEWSLGQAFPSALRKVLEMLREGRSRGGPLQISEFLTGIEAVYVTGGRARKEELVAEISKLQCPVIFGTEGVFAGERGGFHLLQSHGATGWVADLGKSQFKLAAPDRRWIFRRDWARLRAAVEVSPSELPSQRRRLREFVALGFQVAMAETRQRPGTLVFALPTRLKEDGTPHGSSYAGMRGDGTLIPDCMRMAGLEGVPVLVLNDAELAAFGARLDDRLAGFRKVLVLTLGFGIGAALICRPERPQFL